MTSPSIGEITYRAYHDNIHSAVGTPPPQWSHLDYRAHEVWQAAGTAAYMAGVASRNGLAREVADLHDNAATMAKELADVREKLAQRVAHLAVLDVVADQASALADAMRHDGSLFDPMTQDALADLRSWLDKLDAVEEAA